MQTLVRAFDEKGTDASRKRRSLTRRAGKGEAIVKTSPLVVLKLAGGAGLGFSIFFEDGGFLAAVRLFKNNK